MPKEYLPKAHVLGITLLPTFQGINRIFLGCYFASFWYSLFQNHLYPSPIYTNSTHSSRPNSNATAPQFL